MSDSKFQFLVRNLLFFQQQVIFFLMVATLFFFSGCESKRSSQEWVIRVEGAQAQIKAGILERHVELSDRCVATDSVLVDGVTIAGENADEFSVVFWKASPNTEPKRMDYSPEPGVDQQDAVKNQTDALAVEKLGKQQENFVGWIDSVAVSGRHLNDVLQLVGYSSTSPEKGTNNLSLFLAAADGSPWDGLSAEIVYEIYDGFPAIRKWVRFKNFGLDWIKLDHLVLDEVETREGYSSATLLTPGHRGIDPSIVAFSDSAASRGVIRGSEIPSKLRIISEKGAAGYHPDYFERVLGPGEFFESEPVFLFAFSGESISTVSSVSTAQDRCVEGEFQTFLTDKILLTKENGKEVAPVFCTWTNYNANINDENMRVAADIASQIGFRTFQLDAGWSDTGASGGWAVSTNQPNKNNFPDLKDLSSYILSKNMKTGLWYSVFMDEKEANKDADTVLFSLPLIRRSGGLGLSFCYDKSRKKYVDDLVYLHQNFQAGYFKQDLSNICYGDIARGHESRTQKESYLRGLRGLLATQDEIRRQAPGVWLQLSHEIYWETPGPEADLAVLKHVDSYHTAPNEYWGAGNRKELVGPEWNYKVDSLQQKLLQGAFRARDLMYAHRGLPLERIEIFGAVTTNFNGSLTTEIQDRQICSWLMGAPLSFSGDLTSLIEENTERYRSRFEMLDRLQKEYGIYSCFQFSGVPAPTDEDWHWWGKLNEKGCGAVVVLRGSGGEDSRKINIPWVKYNKKYQVNGLFSGNNFGQFTGEQLQNGDLVVSLNKFGQEIIEVAEK